MQNNNKLSKLSIKVRFMRRFFDSAFYGFFRVKELAANIGGSVCSVLQFLPKAQESSATKITISEFKHNNSNRPFAILIQRVDWQPFCPLHAPIQYCKVRGSGNGPLFSAECTIGMVGGLTPLKHYGTKALWNYGTMAIRCKL